MATQRAVAQDYANPDFWRLDALQAPVFLSDAPTLAIAGPGSGKTRTIIAKAARVIRSNGNNGSVVAMVTFTKAAASEMEARLRKAVPEVFASKATKPYIGTFHGLSYALLRQHWKAKGITRKILSDQEVVDLIVRSAKEADCKLKFDEIQRDIERYKSFPADYQLSDADKGSEAYRVFSIYEMRRVANGACDVNDMVRECLAGIRSGAIKPLPVKYLLADEMQDADWVQIDWVLAHHQFGAIPTLVADDDQSIYRFRNAAGFKGLKLFCEATGASVLPMTYNYRSCTTIVDAANLVISGSPDRFLKNIQAKRTDVGGIAFTLHHSTTEPRRAGETVQAHATVTGAQAWLEQHPGASAAVIARTNLELDPIELACKTMGVPFIRLGGSDFLKRPHISRAISALTLPAHPNDNVAYAAACQVSGNIANKAKEAIADFFHDADGQTHVLDLASNASLLSSLRRDDQTAFRTFRNWLSEWFDAVEGTEEEMSKGLVTLLTRFASQCKDEGAARDLNFLAVMLSQWCKGSLAERVNLISQRTEQAKDKAGAVTLCSAHASKGLEFDHVTVINADKENWPHDKSDDAFFEEKRLFYVAMTRAKDHLTISVAQNGEKENEITVFVHPVLAEAYRQSGSGDRAGGPAQASLLEPVNA